MREWWNTPFDPIFASKITMVLHKIYDKEMMLLVIFDKGTPIFLKTLLFISIQMFRIK